MKNNMTGKLYYFFTGEERFQLYIEAFCRGDEAEAKRLIESCPQETYSMNQVAYADRCRASKEIVDMLSSTLAPRLAKLEMIEAFRKTLPYVFDACIVEASFAYLDGHEAGSRRAWDAVGMTGDPPGWREQEEEPEMDRELQSLRRITSRLEEATGGFLINLAELEHELAGEILSVWKGFADFCAEELLLEPEKLVKVWFEPILPEIEKLKNMPDPPEVDQEGLEEYQAAFKRTWSRLTRMV